MSPNYQFQLWHAFYAMALFAVAFALSLGFLVVAAAWFWACYCAGRRSTRPDRFRHLFVMSITYGIVGILFGTCFLGLFIGPAPRYMSRQVQCANNIRQIQLALLNFESANRQFPEASRLDSEGKPMHSWRIWILPYIEQQALYDQYDFDEPWDGPSNRLLIDQMPDVFRCPCQNVENKTIYKIVVGPGTLFDGEKPSISRIEDGVDNTIALVEDFSNPVDWTRPSDVTIEEAVGIVKWENGDPTHHQIDSKFETVYIPGNVGYFDGSVECRCYDYDNDQLRKLFGIDNGYIAKSQTWTDGPYPTTRKMTGWIALGLFLLLMLYPLSWVFRKDTVAQTSGGQ